MVSSSSFLLLNEEVALIPPFINILLIGYGYFGFIGVQGHYSRHFVHDCYIIDHKLFRKYGRDKSPLSPEAKLTVFAIAASAFALSLWCFVWTDSPTVSHMLWAVLALTLIPIGFVINKSDYFLVRHSMGSNTTFAPPALRLFMLQIRILRHIPSVRSWNVFKAWRELYAHRNDGVLRRVIASIPIQR